MGTYKTVLVIGRGRCGTSMTCGILDRLGIDMEIGKRGVKRVRGYYERGPMWTFLRGRNGNFREPFQEGRPDDEFRKEYKKYRKQHDWGFKGKDCLPLLPWILYLENDVYVIVLYRNKTNQAKSIKRNCWGNRADLDKIYQGIIEYNNKVEEFFRKYPNTRRLNLDFDFIIDYPQEAVEKIAKFVGQDVTDEALGFVDKNFRHYG